MSEQIEIKSRTLHTEGDSWQLFKVVEHAKGGIYAEARTRFEIEGEETPEALRAKHEANIADSGEPWEFYALKYPESRDRTLAFLGAIREHAKEQKAREAAVVSAARIRDSQDTSKSVEDRLEAAFVAGEYYDKAIALGADAVAAYGKKMRDGSKKSPHSGRPANARLMRLIRNEWNSYTVLQRREGWDPSDIKPGMFFKWLRDRVENNGKIDDSGKLSGEAGEFVQAPPFEFSWQSSSDYRQLVYSAQTIEVSGRKPERAKNTTLFGYIRQFKKDSQRKRSLLSSGENIYGELTTDFYREHL